MSHFGQSVVWLRDIRQCTPLHVAALHNSVECSQLLLRHRAPLEERDYRGRTPLICAASRGHSLVLGKIDNIYIKGIYYFKKLKLIKTFSYNALVKKSIFSGLLLN